VAIGGYCLIRFENVGMRYGTGPEVLRDINLKIDQGSFHFLTGQSGAGKSSFLKLIYLAARPSRGLISLFDHKSRHCRAANCRRCAVALA